MSVERLAFWGIGKGVVFLQFHVSSPIKEGIDRKCARSEHRRRYAYGCQQDRNPRIAEVGEGDPQFNDGQQRSHDWCPESDQKKHTDGCPNDLRKHRWGKR